MQVCKQMLYHSTLVVLGRLSVSQETFNRTSVKFSLDFVKQQGGIGAAITCTSDVLIGILLYLPMNVGLTLAIPTDAKEFITAGKRFANTACVIELDHFGGGSVLVWGGIMGGNKTRLIFINGKINAEALPFIQFHGPNTFMHNNARPYSAAITRQILVT